MAINFANAALKERESKPPRAEHDGSSFRARLTQALMGKKKHLKTAATPI